ncbi:MULTISPECIES: TonB-dependent receptor [unclassified Brevundimonas]|uniref:TonB-dependent receptor n=1 Tax=unclassified Brevundimonas TaxID=2622653 RepID=UPI0025B861D9|nr:MULTISPECIES: TonB-dependent receptor [unclassified Brevundimonas]
MRILATKTMLLAGAAALSLCAGQAFANEVADSGQDRSTNLGEIVVTAQLRAQDPIEVPFALTAYNGQFLKDLGIQEFEQLSSFVPGFLVQNQSPNNPGFVMRGITSDSGAATAEPRVSVYQDGVSISKSRGSYVELFDLERVEVAKGPQSTLYGRGALIGAVNLVQNRARLGQYDAEGRAEVGNYDYRSVEGFVNLPVGEDFALRLATRMKTRDGTVDNLNGGDDYNGIETQAFRVSAGWMPTDAVRVDLIANYQTDDASGTSFKSVHYDPTNPQTGQVLGGRAPWEGAALTPGGAFDGGKALGLDREVWGVTGLIKWDLSPNMTLNSTTAYRQFDSYETFDPDGISLPLLIAAEEAYGEQWSQELRLNFEVNDRLSGFVSAGYFKEEGYQRTPTQFDERIALAQLAGLLDGNPAGVGHNTLPQAAYPSVVGLFLQSTLSPMGAGALVPALVGNLNPTHIETPTNASELTSFDLFGDLTFKATDRLEFSGGVRYTRDEKTTGYASSVDRRSVAGGLLAIIQGGVPAAQVPTLLGALANPAIGQLPASMVPLFGITAQPTANNGDFIYADHEDDGFTWRLTGRYALSDDASIYANYARGRRPEVLSVGGPSAPLAAPSFKVVEAETVDSFEIGSKFALNEGRLRFDVAGFYYAYDNFQTTVQEGTRFVTTNAGEATSYGFETQVFWAAHDALDVFATYGWNHSRFDTGIYDGNHFRLSPDHMASIGATWRIAASNGTIEVQPTYTWQSKVFFDDNNDIPALQTQNFVADLVQDEYQDADGLLNLRVRYQPASGNWGVEAFGENLLDEEYIKDAGNTGDALGLPTFIAGRPTTYGVAFTVRY